MVNLRDVVFKNILKRPELDIGDAAIEEQKKHIRLLFKKGKARYRSMAMLSESAPEDALIIAERLILDLADLTCLIYGKGTTKSFSGARAKIEKLPNQAIVHLFIIARKAQQEASLETNIYRKRTLVHEQRKILCNALFEIKKAISAEHKALRTALDAYRKKVMFFFFILFLLTAASWGIVWSVNRVKNFRMIEETRASLDDLSNITFKAKMNAEKRLLEITGSSCSYCPCGNGKQLKGLPDTDTCVESWNSAAGKIWQTAEGKSNVPNKYLRDPWDAPYALDENEGEFGTKDCRKDNIRSAGPDGFLETSDDIVVSIPNIFCQDR